MKRAWLLILLIMLPLCCVGCGTRAEDEAAFAAYFARNPLDAAFAQASAQPQQDMAALYTDYAALWQREIHYAYQTLISIPVSGAGPDTAVFNSAYEDWQAKQAAQLQALQAEYQPSGDEELDAILRASLAYNFYRDKAISVYADLYYRRPDYTYAYGPSLPAD